MAAIRCIAIRVPSSLGYHLNHGPIRWLLAKPLHEQSGPGKGEDPYADRDGVWFHLGASSARQLTAA